MWTFSPKLCEMSLILWNKKKSQRERKSTWLLVTCVMKVPSNPFFKRWNKILKHLQGWVKCTLTLGTSENIYLLIFYFGISFPIM